MQLVTKDITVQSTASGLHLVVNHMHQVQKMAPSVSGSLALLMLMTMRWPMASRLLR
jgi:hypothetical protein